MATTITVEVMRNGSHAIGSPRRSTVSFLLAWFSLALASPAWSATGVGYLAAEQNPDGSWGDPQGSGFRDTTVVLDSLAALGLTGASYTQGIAYLAGTEASNLDYLSRQVQTLVGAGQDASALTSALLDGQNAEILDPSDPSFPGRGWGVAAGFGSDPLDTALALRALEAEGFGGGVVVASEDVGVSSTSQPHPFDFALGSSGLRIYVAGTSGLMRLFIETPTSGTLFIDLSPASVPVTLAGLPEEPGTYVLSVENLSAASLAYTLDAFFLRADGFDVSRHTKALLYLSLVRNADGGWGTGPATDSSFMITAEVLRTLAGDTSYASDAVIGDSVALLAALQNPDGGFGSSGTSEPYETGLARLSIARADSTHPSLSAADSYLRAQQQANGSWTQDPYATALALRSLGEDAAPTLIPALPRYGLLVLSLLLLGALHARSALGSSALGRRSER